jgi:hypothetical protein
MSHREKFEILGIRLPERPATLKPRHVAPKPARVDEGEGRMRDRVIVKFVESMTVRLRGGELVADGGSLEELDAVLALHPTAALRRLFSIDETILDEDKTTGEQISGEELADLNNYYLIELPHATDEGVDLANALLRLDVVETAYLMAKAEPPVCADISPPTPLFESHQFYLDPAPDGVDAFFAWNHHPGGNGAGSDFWVIDCEWAWCFGHEDLDIDVSDVVNGSTDNSFPDHGTAVLGEYGACNNDYGVTGISHDVTLKMSDFDSEPSWASNIATAGANLSAGEIFLLEIHIPGPDTGDDCVCNCGQFEFVPVEWDQGSYDAIKSATANGVIVVEAGGNGSVSLDDGAYGALFDLMVRDSGAIIVGAGQPNSHSPECWTNHGRRIDVHGYGSSVATAGYADLFNQSGCTQDYTANFGGTSGASPIIVGVCASIQGIANEKHGFDLSPIAMRNLIKVGGTPQGPPTTKIIRSMPDLVQVIGQLESVVGAPTVESRPPLSALSAPRPNPFQLETRIQFDLRGETQIRVAVFDLQGRRVTTLAEGKWPSGTHAMTWNGLDAAGNPAAAGIYLVRLESPGAVETRKITLLR